MKKINKLGFLSLVGLLGFIGLFTANKGYIGFFGFLAYLRYFRVIPDELFKKHVSTSASIGFFAGLAATVIAIPVASFLLSTDNGPAIVLVTSFVTSVVAFSVSLVVCEMREQTRM